MSNIMSHASGPDIPFVAWDHEELRQRLADLELRLDRLDEPPGVDGTWSVYRIYPDGLPDRVFYVGLSGNPNARADGHNCAFGTPVYAKMKALEGVGIDCTLEVVGRFTNRGMARLFETLLIATTPGLLNRDVSACRRRVGVVVRGEPGEAG